MSESPYEVPRSAISVVQTMPARWRFGRIIVICLAITGLFISGSGRVAGLLAAQAASAEVFGGAMLLAAGLIHGILLWSVRRLQMQKYRSWVILAPVLLVAGAMSLASGFHTISVFAAERREIRQNLEQIRKAIEQYDQRTSLSIR